MNKTACELEKQILSYITTPDSLSISEDEFNKLACTIFKFQYDNNKPYGSYCERLGKVPSNVSRWEEIPALPTSAFKRSSLACFPTKDAEAVFHTSGTSDLETGKHYLYSTKLYHASLLRSFRSYFLRGDARQRYCILTAPPVEVPQSSLIHMIAVQVKQYGTRESKYYVRDKKLIFDQLIGDLSNAQNLEEPVVILGTAFAFVHLFDHCRHENIRLSLPDSSQAMETGGFKGRSREVSKTELYSMFEDYLSIPPHRVVNEYGMTELSSQFYDNTIVDGYQSDEKQIPPWTRIQIMDPRTSQESVVGKPGLIRVFDAANLWSVSSIQTEDLGIRTEHGFEILGRVIKAEPRGCSLSAEMLRPA